MSEDNIARQWWLSQIVDCLQHGAKEKKNSKHQKKQKKKSKYQKRLKYQKKIKKIKSVSKKSQKQCVMKQQTRYKQNWKGSLGHRSKKQNLNANLTQKFNLAVSCFCG